MSLIALEFGIRVSHASEPRPVLISRRLHAATGMLVIGSVPATANAVTAASPQCASVTLDATNASSTLGFTLRSQVSQLDAFATWTDCAFSNACSLFLGMLLDQSFDFDFDLCFVENRAYDRSRVL
jgi:hypothetical protein